jgi:hypothetical protein
MAEAKDEGEIVAPGFATRYMGGSSPAPTRERTPSITASSLPNMKDEKLDLVINTYLEEARTANFSDLELRRVLYKAGQDAEGRAVFVFTPQCAFADGGSQSRTGEEILRRMFLFFLSRMRDHVKEPYVVVYCHTRMSWFSRKHIQWLRNMYKLLGRDFRKNLKAMYVEETRGGRNVWCVVWCCVGGGVWYCMR